MMNVMKKYINQSNETPNELSIVRVSNLMNRNMKYNMKRARQSILK